MMKCSATSGLLVWLLMMTSPEVVARLTLLMNETETGRLLGVPGELYYVREDQVNEYALSFTIPLHTNITRVFFDWFDDSVSTDPPMEYSVSTRVSNLHALYQPTFSISSIGNVPKRRSAFSVMLLCTGLLSTEVKVDIVLNVTAPLPADTLSIKIPRKKTCIRRMQQTSQTISRRKTTFNKGATSGIVLKKAVETVAVNSAEKDARDRSSDRDEMKDDDAMFSSTLFYVCVGALAGILIVVVVVAVVCYLLICARPRRDHVSNSCSLSQPKLATYGEMKRCVTSPQRDKISTRHNQWTEPALSVSNDRTADVIKDVIDNDVDSLRRVFHSLKIEPCRVRLMTTSPVIRGKYSSVHQAVLVKALDDSHHSPVLVKTVTYCPDGGHVMRAVMQDARRLVGMSHVNICPVVAACFDSMTREPVWLVYDSSAANIHLKTFLDKSRNDANLLNATSVTKMCCEMTSAVTHLHGCNIVHRDIAARNFLVDVRTLDVKLTDSALASDIFSDAYHSHVVDSEHLEQALPLPVRWMAVELLDDYHTTAYKSSTDVWALGVALWELMTSGLEPYSDVPTEQLTSYLRRGFRLSQPLCCPSPLFEVVASCWISQPDYRPTSSLLYQAMTSALHALTT